MYTLTIKNQSPTVTTFIVYQKPPTDQSDYVSLAWKTFSVQPMSSTDFSWSLDYWLFAAATGVLADGVRMLPSSAIQVDFNTGNEFNLTPELEFIDARFTNSGKVAVLEEAGIQQNSASLAIGLAKSPMFATQAIPYKTEVFSGIGETYYIAHGNFEEGEVLNLDTLQSQSIQVNFSDESSHTVLYNMEGGFEEF